MPDGAEQVRSPLEVSFSISGRKLTDYLLNIDHPDGRTKARFFLGHGFERDRPHELAAALLRHTANASVLKATPHGWRYVFAAPLETPNGTAPVVISVWQRPPGGGVASFITAYPG